VGEAADGLLSGFLRRHGAVRRSHRNGLRARILRRRSRALCLGRAVRCAGRSELYPRDHEGDRRARDRAGGQREDLLPERAGAVQVVMTARGFTGLRGMAKVAGATMITGRTPMAPSLRLPIRTLAGVLAANFAIAAQAADKVAVGTG